MHMPASDRPERQAQGCKGCLSLPPLPPRDILPPRSTNRKLSYNPVEHHRRFDKVPRGDIQRKRCAGLRKLDITARPDESLFVKFTKVRFTHVIALQSTGSKIALRLRQIPYNTVPAHIQNS